MSCAIAPPPPHKEGGAEFAGDLLTELHRPVTLRRLFPTEWM